MARPEAVALARALKATTAQTVERRSRASYEGIVRALDPLLLDVAGIDEQLTDDDVSIGRALAVHLDTTPLAVGDTLVLVEVAPGDFDAVDVLEG